MLATVLLFPQWPSLQPTTMEVVGYQRVRNALSDGRPDPAAKDGFYVRTTTKWYLVSDSDTVAPDEKGVRHVHVPPYEYPFLSRRSQKGRLRGKLADRFKEVWPVEKSILGKVERTGGGRIGAQDFDVGGGDRHLTFYVRSLVERVETHTEGRDRVTLKSEESFWSVSGIGLCSRAPYLPPKTPMIATESGPHVQVDPPVYGFGTIELPQADSL